MLKQVATQLPTQWVLGTSKPGHKTDHSYLTDADGKNCMEKLLHYPPPPPVHICGA
jgi:hypothetical protein